MTHKRRLGAAAAVLAALLLATAGCAAGSSAGAGGARASAAGDSVDTGASAPPGSSQNRSVGSFSTDFAACMRAHGVPNFPDPDGRPGQLGPDSGIDPTSAPFQAALNGPCESLAPPEWLDSGSDSGPDSVPGTH